MAATIQVAGPTVVYIGESILGYSDNDNLPAVAFSDFIHEVKTVMSGAVPEELVLQNTSATITLTLVKWDESIYEGMLTTQRGIYNTTTVGSQLVSGAHTFALTLESVNGNATYSFARCYIQPDGISDAQWGNRERTLTLTIKAIPDQDNELFTYSNTAPVPPAP